MDEENKPLDADALKALGVPELRKLTSERAIGDPYWRAKARKADLIEALLTGKIPAQLDTEEEKPAQPAAGTDDAAAKIAAALAPLFQEQAKKGIDAEAVRKIVLEELNSRRVNSLEIKSPAGTAKIEKPHYKLADLVKIVSAGLHVWVVGPAGSGKTTAAEQTAEILKSAFYCQSVSQQTPVSALTGYMDANSHFVETAFYRAYSGGGVFVLDEADAGNANVLATLNAAVANGVCSFPCGMVKRHENFRLIACANTFGLGADRKYVGRAPIDAATLDRFAFFEFPYDEKLEREVAGNDDWVSKVQAVRKKAGELKVDAVISPRASIQGARLLAAGFKESSVEQMVLWRGMTKDTISKLREAL